MLSDKQIEQFQNIYQRKTGKAVDKKEARELGEKVCNLFMAIYDLSENSIEKIIKNYEIT